MRINNTGIFVNILLLLLGAGCSHSPQEENEQADMNSNALINETSPYLLQHAHNPVNWYPWSDEALEKAREENKLLLISIGYSACHWCHVMERETFENEEAAAFMNAHFVNIKVDREERPDVDQIYMNAVQLMTNRGGWPLNCFALPDGRPVYGGTYFSTEQWMQVMQSIVDLKTSEPERMIEYAEQLTEGIQQSELIETAVDADLPTPERIDQLINEWRSSWDTQHGGAKHAPKFPLPNSLEFILHFAASRQDAEARDFVKLSLDKMAMGGIYDQIGGGFARYSTDEIWKVPHFEKMLYDNAQLVSLYARAYRFYQNPAYRDVVYQTLAFVDRELSAPNGGFYSALDADTEGEEGKYYIWTAEELESTLGESYDLLADYYNINAHGLWENDHYILTRTAHPAVYAGKKALDPIDFSKQLDSLNAKLLRVRQQRTRPEIDDKQLTSWNALMVSGYCEAYRSFNEKKWLDRAQKAMQLLLTACRRSDGGLYHSYKDGQARINGYLEDYAFVVEALLDLYEVTFDSTYLIEADALTRYAIAHFRDDENGMFWFTSDLDEALIARKQEVRDNVIPASNSAMAKALHRLGTITDQREYKAMAKSSLKNVASVWDYGQSFSNWGILALRMSEPYHAIAITGESANGRIVEGLNKHYLPDAVFMGGSDEHVPLLRGKGGDEPIIYVCIEGACKMPVTTVSDALNQLPPR